MNINDIELEDLLSRGFKLEFQGKRKNDVGELEPDPTFYICTKDSLYIEKDGGVLRFFLDISELDHYAYMKIKGIKTLEDLVNLHRLIHG